MDNDDVPRLRCVSLHKGITYGPVNSRRLGRSLGVNLLGTAGRVCPFNCIYCQLRDPRKAVCHRTRCDFDCARCPDAVTERMHSLGSQPTLPDVQAVLEALEQELRAGNPLDNICFSGDGEPTVHPAFDQIAEGARAVRDRWAPNATLSVLSNSATLGSPRTQRGLAQLDFRILKLDVGNTKAFNRLNRPCKAVDFARIVARLKELDSFILQTMLVDGAEGNAGPEDVASWIEVVAGLRPMEVQLYSLGRVPLEAGLRQVPGETLEERAEALRRNTGLKVTVY